MTANRYPKNLARYLPMKGIFEESWVIERKDPAIESAGKQIESDECAWCENARRSMKNTIINSDFDMPLPLVRLLRTVD